MQEQNGINQQNDNRRRRLITASVVMMTLALGVLGTIFYRSRQAASGAYQAAQVQQSLELTQPQKDAQLAKASLLRDKWRVWALAHKRELRNLLKSQPSDQTALMAVWKALPEDVDSVKGGITNHDLIPTQNLEAAIESGTSVFSWEPVDKRIQSGSEVALRMQQNFANLRDIEVSSSVNLGPSQISLWASGRVTRETQVEKRVPVVQNGKTVTGLTLVDGPHQELLPPYDFLR